MPEDGAEQFALLPPFSGGRRGDDDRLSVDHLAHHSAGGIGRGHEDGIETQFLRGDLLQVAEEDVARRVRAGQGHTEPAEQRAEDRVEQRARSG